MTTSYDELWTSVRENYKGNDSDIPQSEEAVYRFISNAVNVYNQKAKKYEGRLTSISCNEATEEISPNLTSSELMILTYIACSLIARDVLLCFSTTFGVFAKEMGVSNIKGQTDSLRQNLDYFEDEVQQLIEDLVDSFNL